MGPEPAGLCWGEALGAAQSSGQLAELAGSWAGLREPARESSSVHLSLAERAGPGLSPGLVGQGQRLWKALETGKCQRERRLLCALGGMHRAGRGPGHLSLPASVPSPCQPWLLSPGLPWAQFGCGPAPSSCGAQGLFPAMASPARPLCWPRARQSPGQGCQCRPTGARGCAGAVRGCPAGRPWGTEPQGCCGHHGTGAVPTCNAPVLGWACTGAVPPWLGLKAENRDQGGKSPSRTLWRRLFGVAPQLRNLTGGRSHRDPSK